MSSSSTSSDDESSNSSVDLKRRRSRSRSKHRSSHKHKSRNHRRHNRSQSRKRDSHRRKRSRSRSHRRQRRHHKHSKSRRDRFQRGRKESGSICSPVKSSNFAIKNLDDRLKEEKVKWETTNNIRAKQIEQKTGITIPKYMNPSTMNAARYVEQMQKRKLLWSNKDDQKDKNAQVWSATSLVASGGDMESAAKFRKLMGIHDDTLPVSTSCIDNQKIREQEKLFQRLDAEYQSGRSQTHTSRGVGLGYNNSSMVDPSLFSGYKKE